MRFAALAAEVTVFNVLLGVVPGTAAGGHRDGHEDARDDRAHEHAAQSLGPEDETDENRHDDGQHGRNDHFLNGGTREHAHGLGVVGLGLAFHDAGDFLELTAHFNDDGTGGAAHGFHGHGAEEVGNQTADDQTGDDVRVGEVKLEVDVELLLQGMRVVGKKHEGRKTGRANGVALGHGLGGVAHGVERIGDVAHLFVEFGHFGDAARVVRNRTVGVKRDDDAGHGQHAGGGNGHTVQARERVAHENGHNHGQNRQGGGLHRDRQARDDVGAVTGGRGLRHGLHGLVFGARVVLGDHDHQGGQNEADQSGTEEVQRRDALG